MPVFIFGSCEYSDGPDSSLCVQRLTPTHVPWESDAPVRLDVAYQAVVLVCDRNENFLARGGQQFVLPNIG